MYSESARKEIENLVNELDQTKVRIARFAYAMADEFRFRVIRNIDDTFGARAKGNAKYVKKMSARKLGASGNLRNSVVLSSRGPFSFTVSVGNEQVPYAAIHEFGGIIRPKRMYLTIPCSFENGQLVFFNPITSGHRAREFDLYKKGKFLVFQNDEKQARRRAWQGDVAYLLAKKANMPPRPYFRPAAESLEKDREFQIEQMEIAGLDPSMWRID